MDLSWRELVKICVTTVFPGGLDGNLANAFEDSDLLDYFEIGADGTIEHDAQTRKCTGGCADSAESVVRRGVEKIIVRNISPDSFLKLHLGWVKVYVSRNPSVRGSLRMIIDNSLRETDFRGLSGISREIEES
jgi:predicted Fe-Mo cluster-binding NifX family protein